MATELGRFLSEQLAGLERDHSDRAFLEHIERLTESYINPLSRLTPRGRQVLGLMAQGFSNETIGKKLVIEKKPVENYINVIFRKTGVSSMDSMVDRRVQCVLLYQINTPDFKNPFEAYFGDNEITPLSPRQKEVVELIGEGYSNSAIATKLTLSIGSVMNYVNILNQKIPVDHQKYVPRVALALVAQTMAQ